jgi:aminoglycoside phosphotransferase (APT) family kinase protein
MAAGLEGVPRRCASEVARALGEVTRVDLLDGLSGASVRRVTATGGSAILKIGPDPSEREFYRSVAPALRSHGLDLPALVAEGRDGALEWVLVEDIPRQLPRSRWLADPGVLAWLRRLHEIPADAVGPLRRRYALQASDATIERALAWVSPELRRAVADDVARVLAAAGDGSAPRLVSGDANPMNWGVRRDGSPVLYDWGRFGVGPAELDLATTVPGLGTAADYAAVAARYGASALARRVGVAKLWTVLELLEDTRADQPAKADVARWCGERLPAWLASERAFLLSSSSDPLA